MNNTKYLVWKQNLTFMYWMFRWEIIYLHWDLFFFLIENLKVINYYYNQNNESY